MRLLAVALAGLALGAAPPKPVHLGILFPEGFTARQMVARVAAVRGIAIRKRHVTPRLTAKAYAAALGKTPPPAAFRQSMRTRSLEGFLFPSRYEFGPSTTASQLIAQQLREFEKEWKRVGPLAVNASPYDVLTVASMVEAEVAVPDERPLVAAVIYNRLAQEMPLGIDATLRYGLHIPGTQALTKAALATDTPYNTRLHTGLPPTPISNPGLASLRAAARPAPVDYLYYVRIPNTVTHYFTADYADFCEHVTEYGYGGC
jgi:UPF0755 protein